LLGAAPSLPVAPLARLFRPIWIAFWLTAASGVVMLAADLEAKLGNRLFPPKMLLVAAAVAFMAVLRRRVSSRARPRSSAASRSRRWPAGPAPSPPAVSWPISSD